MIWLPFVSSRQNLEILTDEHVFDVVFEGMQCLRNIYRDDVTWRDARMWVDAPASLLLYVTRAEREMVRRGYDPEPRVMSAHVALSREEWQLAPIPPWWFGSEELHMSHRSHLIRVNPEHYTRRLPFTTPLELPLIWPGERNTA